MELAQAKALKGQAAKLVWLDRKGQEVSENLQVFDVAFVPMYGPCLVTDVGNVSLDRVVSVLVTKAAA